MTLIAPLRRPTDSDSAVVMRECGEVLLTRVGALSRWPNLSTFLARGGSFRIARHRFREVELELRRVLRTGKWDLALIDTLFTSYLIPSVRELAPRARVVLLEHNVESLLARRYSDRAPLLARAAGRIESRRLLAAERAALAAADRVIALSGDDKAELMRICPSAEVFALPPGVRTYPGAVIAPPERPRRCLFLGSFRWAPNREAARWLARDIFPLVLARVPDAELVLAGESASTTIRSLASVSRSIRIPDRVTDAASAVRSAAVSLVPIRTASGVRLKILEAFANERPVVSTAIGSEGLPVTDGEHLLVADTTDSFAEAIVSILTDPARAARIARNGRSLAERSFDWEGIIDAAESILLLD